MYVHGHFIMSLNCSLQLSGQKVNNALIHFHLSLCSLFLKCKFTMVFEDIKIYYLIFPENIQISMQNFVSTQGKINISHLM